jgi:formate dehydrogenase iron-sulfur subunit
MEPACAKACPTGAILFGDREELVQEAHARIQARPDKYVDHVYGEKEAGGTSKLYISPVAFEKAGFPSLTTEPIPRYSDVAMLAVPPTVVGVTVAMAGVYWITSRRDKMRLAAKSVQEVGAPVEERSESSQRKEEQHDES